MKRIQCIEKNNFDKYGFILEFPDDFQEPFYVAVREEKEPWRLAVFRYRNKSVKMLECHPESMESFEPLKGVTVLVLAEHEKPEQFQVFLLDKPVCLHKGIWHQVLSLTEEAQVKITENIEVKSEFYEFPRELELGLAEME